MGEKVKKKSADCNDFDAFHQISIASRLAVLNPTRFIDHSQIIRKVPNVSSMPSINPRQPDDPSAFLPPRYLAVLAPVPEIEGSLIESDRTHQEADQERILPKAAFPREWQEFDPRKAFKVS